MKYIVELQAQTWLAPWSGDPGRTLKIERAKVYKTIKGANIALGKARKYAPFSDAKITPIRDVWDK